MIPNALMHSGAAPSEEQECSKRGACRRFLQSFAKEDSTKNRPVQGGLGRICVYLRVSVTSSISGMESVILSPETVPVALPIRN